MNPDSTIHVADYRGLVGSAIVRNLRAKGFQNLVTRTHAELNLTDRPMDRAASASSAPAW